MSNSFIKRYVDTITPYTDIPEIFLIGAGFYIMSATLGRYFKFKNFYDTRLNEFIVLASPSFMTRRGEIFKHV